MSLDDDLLAMLAGPLGVDVRGPDGVIRGARDQRDEESYRVGDFGGRSQTRLDRLVPLVIRTSDLGTIARQTEVEIDDVTYRVQDIRRLGDGLETVLALVEVG